MSIPFKHRTNLCSIVDISNVFKAKTVYARFLNAIDALQISYSINSLKRKSTLVWLTGDCDQPPSTFNICIV